MVLGGDNAAGQGLAPCYWLARTPTDPGPTPAVSAAAQAEADRLLALVHAPSGARAVTADPTGGGPIWLSAAPNGISSARSWKLTTTSEQSRAWLLSYNPPGFARAGLKMMNAPDSSGSAKGPGGHESVDRTYEDLGKGHWSRASLNVAVSRGPHNSAYLDVTGIVYSLDDHVRPDVTACSRLRVLADRSCPDMRTDHWGVSVQPGVANPDQPDLDRMLVPTEAPTGGLICYYGWETTPLAQRVLDGSAAAAIAESARAVHLEHDDYQGPFSGLSGGIGAFVVALSYPDRPDVDVRSESYGGPGHVANGHIEAEGSPYGDSGFTCVLVHALPNPPQPAASMCADG